MMTQTKSPTAVSPAHSASSDNKWKSKEARIMLSLLQGEYQNSKRLSIHRRYKDLERIITMFTSEPVLDKMKWLSEEEEDEDMNACFDDVSCKGSFDIDDSSDREDADGDDKMSFSPRLVAEIGRFISKMKMLSTLPTMTFSQSASSFPSMSNSSSSSSTSSSDASIFTFSDYQNSNAFSDSLTTSNSSAPATPVFTSKTPEMSTCQSWPLFKRLISDSVELSTPLRQSQSHHNDSSAEISTPVHTSKQWKECNSPNSNEFKNGNKERLYQRRNHELDMCIIKKDEIPAFEIPPLRTSKSKNETTDTIVPSLYINSTSSHPNSPTSNKQFIKFRTSSSSPNIHRSGASSFDLDQHSISSSKSFIDKVRQVIRRDSKSDMSISSFSINSDDSDGEFDRDFDIQEVHCVLEKMKQEFEELSNWNLLSRYKKMKKMLKSCGKL